MNDMIHDSHNLFFRNPFGAVSCGQKISLRLQVMGDDKVESVFLHLKREGFEEERIPMKFYPDHPRTYEIEIITPSSPCLLFYYFSTLQEETVTYYGNQADCYGGKGKLAKSIPPPYQITVVKEGATTPNWFKDAVIYQIFVDRFCQGDDSVDPSKLKAGSLIHAHWKDIPVYTKDPVTGEILAYDFFGGNLQGIIKKLSYLKELGVTVLYLNPIFESISNHKYDTGNYEQVDPMYGDNQLFQELCSKAEALGIRLILDGVFSHTGSDSVYFNREGEYPELGAYQSKESPYYNWYEFKEFPNRYECWWNIETMPNVNELEPSYLQFIIESENSILKQWMTRGAKGWRLDVADELPDEFIKSFKKQMQEQDAESVLIGEVWEDASNKISYGKRREYLEGESFDSVMNYPLRQIVIDFLLGKKDGEAVHRALMSLYENYPIHNFYALMNLIGSHDVPRILTLLGEAPEEHTLTIKERGMFQLSKEDYALALSRLKLMVLWQMTFPGVPSIYYGDEAGLEGYSDPLNRRTYPWGNEDKELIQFYQKMIALRHQHMVLRTGEWKPISIQDDVYGYLRSIQDGKDLFGRTAENNIALVLLNRNPQQEVSVSIDLRSWCQDVIYNGMLNGWSVPLNKGILELRLKPLEGKVFFRHFLKEASRKSGILLHPTSLPSPYGIGDLGKEAYEFIDFLSNSGQGLWQILPYHPAGGGDSPYQSLSAFAGNPLWVSPEGLFDMGFLTEEELESTLRESATLSVKNVEFEKVRKIKEKVFLEAFYHFTEISPLDYEDFFNAQSFWLEDYGLFMALKSRYHGKPWYEWDEALASRKEEALQYWKAELKEEISYHYFLQYIFFKQWMKLKDYAKIQGIELIGDLSFVVSHDSCDVWVHQSEFTLDEKGHMEKIAGVPPDYFSLTGQCWGMPLYRWDQMKKNDYQWWQRRFEQLLTMVDVIRLDHFRGFEAYWEIPGGETTGVKGKWKKGPGEDFFHLLQKHLDSFSLIVEDLGLITSEVEALRNRFSFSGIHVLQFDLKPGEMEGRSYPENSVLYTGTHDNETLASWCQGKGVTPWDYIEWAYQSSAKRVIVPLQDVLELENEARMNVPGTAEGNWKWRYTKEELTSDHEEKLKNLTKKYQR